VLRSNRCLLGAPSPTPGRVAPVCTEIDNFKLNEPATWTSPAEVGNDPQLGRVRIRLWQICISVRPQALHAVAKVERLDEQRFWRVPKPLWLTWVGEEMPHSAKSGDFTCGVLRLTTGIELPNNASTGLWLGKPKQCERWSDLMPLMTWELWLARDIVADNPLPWQSPRPI